ncbi:hypothetical protein [Ruegeria atlantica]|nr:hypothetical protein [Ruegeria atlantica]
MMAPVVRVFRRPLDHCLASDIRPRVGLSAAGKGRPDQAPPFVEWQI